MQPYYPLPTKEAAEAHGFKYQVDWHNGGKAVYERVKSIYALKQLVKRLEARRTKHQVTDLTKIELVSQASLKKQKIQF